MADLATLRRRRGASITRLTTLLSELEGATEESTTSSHAQLLRKKLEAEFKLHHLAVIDAVVDDEAAAVELDTTMLPLSKSGWKLY